VQGLLSNLGVARERRLLSEDGCRRVLQEQSNGMDLVMGVPLRFGLGFALPNETMPFPSPSSCGWGGYGGSVVLNDLDNALTVAYVMNRMIPGTLGDDRAGGILAATYVSLLAGA
jgi:hypothetical protein